MTLHWSTAVLLAVVGAVAREVGLGLLALADTFDPPVVRRAPINDGLLYVPDCFLVDQR